MVWTSATLTITSNPWDVAERSKVLWDTVLFVWKPYPFGTQYVPTLGHTTFNFQTYNVGVRNAYRNNWTNPAYEFVSYSVGSSYGFIVDWGAPAFSIISNSIDVRQTHTINFNSNLFNFQSYNFNSRSKLEINWGVVSIPITSNPFTVQIAGGILTHTVFSFTSFPFEIDVIPTISVSARLATSDEIYNELQIYLYKDVSVTVLSVSYAHRSDLSTFNLLDDIVSNWASYSDLKNGSDIDWGMSDGTIVTLTQSEFSTLRTDVYSAFRNRSDALIVLARDWSDSGVEYSVIKNSDNWVV